ncbi:hypothetical protein [Paraburkholderia adhaesiva]|uniref:hypothetical protein n=1 Tax=Paraburkholderia adhaesiva TaxID=2883244 RepID=UPI001F17FC4F|nr:hypothetical protein [Paraburkholderia adhaesiva]
MPLTSDEWRDTAAVFTESVEFVLNNVTGPLEELRDKLTDFLTALILAEKPYMLASARGLDRAIDLVFADPEICDFVLMIVFVFFSRWGASPDRYASLVESLAFGVTADDYPRSGPTPGLVAMPPEIRESLPDPAHAQDFLLRNKWLSVLLLIHLFVVIPRAKRSPKAARSEALT